jgi:probable rRNA maturation factor
MPSLHLSNRQRKSRIDLTEFRYFAEAAMARISQLVDTVALPAVISVAFVSDARIAQIHREFMSVAGPTDVITFHHGEIVISPETAARQAKIFNSTLRRELRLYFVHGLLHLAGWDDSSREGRQKMTATQERIVDEIDSMQAKTVSSAQARAQGPADA